MNTQPQPGEFWEYDYHGKTIIVEVVKNNNVDERISCDLRGECDNDNKITVIYNACYINFHSEKFIRFVTRDEDEIYGEWMPSPDPFIDKLIDYIRDPDDKKERSLKRLWWHKSGQLYNGR